MKISDILSEDRVVTELHAADKEAMLREVAAVLCERSACLAGMNEEVSSALTNRERLGSTGVGEGVAIPHAKIPGLGELVACFARSTIGVPFDSVDKQPVKLVFVLLIPENSAGAHLKALARVSRLLKDRMFRDRLLSAESDAATLFGVFLEEDRRS